MFFHLRLWLGIKIHIHYTITNLIRPVNIIARSLYLKSMSEFLERKIVLLYLISATTVFITNKPESTDR